MTRWTTQLVLFGVIVGALSGCARVVPLAAPPSAAPPSTAPSAPPAQPAQPAQPAPSVPADQDVLPPPVPAEPLPSSSAESSAVSCAGRPGGDQVLALLRSKGVPAAATIQAGPLCAGTWQYTVVLVSPREPVQVITKGAPGQLELVTMGTDVCTGPVKAGAPTGILTVAHCN